MLFHRRMFPSVCVAILLGALLHGCAGRTVIKRQTLNDLRTQNNKQSQWIQQLSDKINSHRRTIQSLQNEKRTIKTQLQKKRKTLSSLRSQLTSARTKKNNVQTKLTHARQVISSLRSNLKQIQQQTGELSNKLTANRRRIQRIKQTIQGQMQTLTQQNQQLESKLSNIRRATTRTEGNNVVLNLQSRILFDLGRYQLKSEAHQTLRSVADILKQYPERPIGVEGHTDTVPVTSKAPFPSNLHLSAYRAISVIEFLTGNTEINRDRLRAVGYGSEKPLKPNTTPENRRVNRRVELVIYPPTIKTKTIPSNP